ncbi:hypothetical protein SISNIDRAFT_448004 [Sistotremastrum niveocremeum HHB9708]|uniref:Uncharacterized protein n=1 Tax=Sistotremastrum niveocremeum HHB9708 TaxID=1314777 RepID=A0A165AK97_9AGAM|nr:hypothetical protein SISNIDRAFT_448004 [Sistotremastrum niveocremeum HHB9708]
MAGLPPKPQDPLPPPPSHSHGGRSRGDDRDYPRARDDTRRRRDFHERDREYRDPYPNAPYDRTYRPRDTYRGDSYYPEVRDDRRRSPSPPHHHRRDYDHDRSRGRSPPRAYPPARYPTPSRMGPFGFPASYSRSPPPLSPSWHDSRRPRSMTPPYPSSFYADGTQPQYRSRTPPRPRDYDERDRRRVEPPPPSRRDDPPRVERGTRPNNSPRPVPSASRTPITSYPPRRSRSKSPPRERRNIPQKPPTLDTNVEKLQPPTKSPANPSPRRAEESASTRQPPRGPKNPRVNNLPPGPRIRPTHPSILTRELPTPVPSRPTPTGPRSHATNTAKEEPELPTPSTAIPEKPNYEFKWPLPDLPPRVIPPIHEPDIKTTIDEIRSTQKRRYGERMQKVKEARQLRHELDVAALDLELSQMRRKHYQNILDKLLEDEDVDIGLTSVQISSTGSGSIEVAH